MLILGAPVASTASAHYSTLRVTCFRHSFDVCSNHQKPFKIFFSFPSPSSLPPHPSWWHVSIFLCNISYKYINTHIFFFTLSVVVFSSSFYISPRIIFEWLFAYYNFILFYFPPLTDWYIYNFLALSKDFDCQSALQIFGNARSDSISAPFSFEKIRRRARRELLIEHQQLSPVKLWRSFCSVCSTQTEQLNCDIVRTGRFWSVVKMYKTWSVWQLLLIIPIWQLEWLTVWFVITMIVSRRRGWGFRNGNLEHGLELKMFVSSFVEVTSLNESNRVVGDEWTRSVYCNLQYNSVERVTIVFIERTSMII